MTLYSLTDAAFSEVPQTTFHQAKLLERRDLQALLKKNISVISPDLMVISEEFGGWVDSNRRIDLLCLDQESNLVVVELKRTEDGGHMELQAIRYAAMVSAMTFDQVVSAHAEFIGGEDAKPRATSAILSFLDADTPETVKLSGDVRIVLVSSDFSRELTTAVLWLNKRDLDITCIRLKPYLLDSQLLVDVEPIIPLPEAADYETKIKAQEQEERRVRSARHDIFKRFWAQLITRSINRTSLLANRRTTADHWLPCGMGRSGFNLTFTMRHNDSQVECYIDMGREAGDRNLRAFEALRARSDEIHKAFGEELEWQELPESRGCRIRKVLSRGWSTPEADWPNLQEEMIDAMVKLENALRKPVLTLQLP